jgi:uncharacterized protein YegP (UPF0339 family)
MAKTKFEVYKDSKGQYRWRLLAQNGEPVASGGEGFVEKRTALNAVKKLKEWANTTNIFDAEKAKEEAAKEKASKAKAKDKAKAKPKTTVKKPANKKPVKSVKKAAKPVKKEVKKEEPTMMEVEEKTVL